MDKQSFFYAFKELVKDEKYHLLLESGRGGQQSVAGWNPMAVVRSTDDGLLISWRDGQEETRVGESLHLLEALIDEYKLPVNVEFPDFQGGAAGFISYDYARKIENLPNLAEDDLQIPDLYFYLFDEWAVYDVAEEQVHLMKLSSSDVDLAKRERDWQLAGEKGLKSQKFAEGAATDVVHDVTKLQVSLSADVFEEAVRKVQNYIAQGDVFQVNLSVRQAKELGAEPMQMYEALRSFNPSPYMAFIQSPEFAVVSGSPELLVKKKGRSFQLGR